MSAFSSWIVRTPQAGKSPILPYRCVLLLRQGPYRNLQYANHVIFVSSLVARTQHEYKASITQAIGRVLRMGQTNPVHVYYVLAEKTIEVNILEDRKGKVLVERGGTSLLVSDALKGEEDRFRGLPFRGAACGAGVDLDDDDEDEGEGGGDGEDRA